MKKAIALMILLALSVSLISCGKNDKEDEKENQYYVEDAFVPYYEMGFYYALPAAFEMKNFSYGDVVFADGNGAYFYFTALDSEELNEDWIMAGDISTREFAQVIVNDLDSKSEVKPDGLGYQYREEDSSAHFEYFFEYGDDSPSEYYRYMIIRNSVYLYVITLTCNTEDAERYDTVFDRIIKTIKVEEPQSAS